MLDSVEQTILSTLQTIFDQFGWWGVFGLMIFENATGITPSEIILGFAGWMLIERQVGRVIPGVRTLVSIPAGLVRIPFPKIFLATFAGAYVWCTLLIGAGYILGHEWHLISETIKTHLLLVFILGFLIITAYLVYHYRASLPLPARKRRNNEELE